MSRRRVALLDVNNSEGGEGLRDSAWESVEGCMGIDVKREVTLEYPRRRMVL